MSGEGYIQEFPEVMDPQADGRGETPGPDDRETPVWA